MKENFSKIYSIRSFHPPEGGVVSFPELRKGIQSEKYCDDLYENTGVFILPGKNFEKEGFVRVGFGESPEIFQNGIDLWIEFEKSYNLKEKK